jgi:hypothetical protein
MKLIKGRTVRGPARPLATRDGASCLKIIARCDRVLRDIGAREPTFRLVLLSRMDTSIDPHPTVSPVVAAASRMGRFALIAFVTVAVVAQSLWLALLAWLAIGIFW